MQQSVDGHVPVQRQKDGLFPFPRTRYGILPYCVDSRQILWGVIETDRVGPVIFTPAAGTQDLIAIKDEHSITLELSKPMKDYSKHIHASFLTPFAGQLLRDEVYQQVLNGFQENGYQLYFESPMATAIHEAYEEHGLDLRHDQSVLVKPIEQALFKCTSADKGDASLCLWMPQVRDIMAIKLKHTQKVEEKIRRNHGRVFYEKGAWVTLNELKTRYEAEQFKLKQDVYPPLVVQIMSQFQVSIRHIDMMEAKFKPANGLFAKARTSEASSFLTEQSQLFNLFF
jgi:hypothetical protein